MKTMLWGVALLLPLPACGGRDRTEVSRHGQAGTPAVAGASVSAASGGAPLSGASGGRGGQTSSESRGGSLASGGSVALGGRGDGGTEHAGAAGSGASPGLAGASGTAGKQGTAGDALACTDAVALGNFMPAVACGDYPQAVALADLNADGNDDAVVLSNAGASVILGKGGGLFAAQSVYTSALAASSFALGDFDGDGKLDLVTVGGKANVMLGSGDGTFAATVEYATAKGSQAVVVGDVNLDGKPDLVTANVDTSTVSVLLGKGDGTFAAHVDYPTGDSPYTLVIGDVDGDEKLDLVTVSAKSPSVSVLLGGGDGQFAQHLDFPSGGDVGTALVSAALGDLNGDGQLDLVVGSYHPGTLSVLLGVGAGKFAAPTNAVGGEYLRSVTLRDLNGDGRLDLAIVFGGTVSVLLHGQGDGTFAERFDYPVTRDPLAAAIADLNGDAEQDFAIAFASDGSNGELGVLLASGRAGPAGGPFDPVYPTGASPAALALGDVNGDHKLDVVTANQAGTVSVLLGNGDAALGTSHGYAVADPPTSVALGDLNGDGELDIVTASYTAASVSTLLGQGDGTFADGGSYPTANQPCAVAVGDLNADGKPDIVTASNRSISDNGMVSVLLAMSGGMFAANVDYGAGMNTQAVALGDLNNDGKLDIVAANAGADGGWSVSVMLGKGDGTFLPKVDYTPGGGSASVALGDLNGDGNLDIVTGNGLVGGSVSVFVGKGDGTFAAAMDYRTIAQDEEVVSIALGDVNGDGMLDVVAAGRSPTVTSVLLGKGNATLATAVDYAVYAAPLALGDLNADGKADVVGINNVGSVQVLPSSCR